MLHLKFPGCTIVTGNPSADPCDSRWVGICSLGQFSPWHTPEGEKKLYSLKHWHHHSFHPAIYSSDRARSQSYHSLFPFPFRATLKNQSGHNPKQKNVFFSSNPISQLIAKQADFLCSIMFNRRKMLLHWVIILHLLEDWVKRLHQQSYIFYYSIPNTTTIRIQLLAFWTSQ